MEVANQGNTDDPALPDWDPLTGTKNMIVLCVQVIGIIFHLLLLVFMGFNLVKHIYKLN